MKKITLIILTFLLVAVLAIPALAADASVTVTPSTKEITAVDQTIVFTVKISGSAEYTSIGAKLEYDTAVFAFESAETMDIKGTSLNVFDEGKGNLLIAFSKATAYSGDLVKITLKVKNTAAISSATVNVKPTCKNGNDTMDVQVSAAKLTVQCKHEFGEWKIVDDTHQRMCSKCQDVQTEKHDWNDGKGNPAPTCETAGKMEYTCIICQAKKTETVSATGHNWDSNCDSECNNCGEKREAAHKFATTWSSDAEGHWYACTYKCGEKKDYAAHTASSDGKSCTVCKAKLTTDEHVHDMSTEWITDANYHWHRCNKKNPSCYYVEDKAAHDYDDGCDATCNTCGYVRLELPHNYLPEWQANAEGHWQVCADCNAHSIIVGHIPGPEATETEPQLCVECNFRMKMPLNHVHNYGDVWYSDDHNHWQSCGECAEATPMEPHTWSDGEMQLDGTFLYTCTICGMELILDNLMPSEPATVPSQSVQPDDPKGSGRFPWQWAGIAAVVLLAVGVVLLIIEFVRSRKTNMHGRFSK